MLVDQLVMPLDTAANEVETADSGVFEDSKAIFGEIKKSFFFIFFFISHWLYIFFVTTNYEFFHYIFDYINKKCRI